MAEVCSVVLKSVDLLLFFKVGSVNIVCHAFPEMKLTVNIGHILYLLWHVFLFLFFIDH